MVVAVKVLIAIVIIYHERLYLLDTYLHEPFLRPSATQCMTIGSCQVGALFYARM